MNELRPFSEGITTGSEPTSNVDSIQPSNNIDKINDIDKFIEIGGAGDLPLKSSKDFEGYTNDYKAELVGKGFDRKDINNVEKLGKNLPEKGYKRYTDPKHWVEGDAYEVTRVFGFVDVDENGMIHKAFPLY